MTKIAESLLNEFLSRRKIAVTEARRARLALMNSDADFRKLEQTRLEVMVRLAEAKAKNTDTAPTLQKEYDDAVAATNAYLERLPEGINSVSPHYHCPICCDTGKVGEDYCTCFIEALRERLFARSGMPYTLAITSLNVDKVEDDNQREELQALYRSLNKYLESYPNSKFVTRVICGGVGVGKSTAAIAIATQLISVGYGVYFVSGVKMNEVFLKYHLAPITAKPDLIHRFLEEDLLVIDDLGCEPLLKNVTVEYLVMVLNERVTRGKHTIITTNLDGDRIFERYGERVYSRLFDYHNSKAYYISGKDLRLRK